MLDILVQICCFFMIVSSLFMLLSNNPVYSVLFLILVFFFNSILFILLNGDIIGIFILIIYVGAIAVLFLFIVMLVNLKTIEPNQHTYLIIGSVFFFFFFFEIMFLSLSLFDTNPFSISDNVLSISISNVLDDSNKDLILSFIGFYIFLKYPVLLLLSIIQLVVGIISAIELTNFKSGFSSRKQYSQLSRNESLAITYIY
jgi:NADH:ubiquinone oxidoreductase subunit 6 (subunit J)